MINRYYNKKYEEQISFIKTKFESIKELLNDIIDRLDEDKEFQKRQSFVGFFAKSLKKFGFLKFLNSNAFHFFHPYMKIEVTKKR